ncbi:MAG TPA: hypothetical protein VJB35_01035 [Candidatus Nanoarchaeia archaeon]|nr:hypothetical protein [Candidatus Nanoarchaeia archaeon]
MREDLVEYFIKNLKKGYNPRDLKYTLVAQGYQKFMIDEALKKATKEMERASNVSKDKPEIKYEAVDEGENTSIEPKKSFWKSFKGLFKKKEQSN